MTGGALGMQVMAVRSVSTRELVYASEIEFEFLGKAKDAVVRIWPPNDDAVRWPPSRAMTQQDVEDWTGMWNPTNWSRFNLIINIHRRTYRACILECPCAMTCCFLWP